MWVHPPQQLAPPSPTNLPRPDWNHAWVSVQHPPPASSSPSACHPHRPQRKPGYPAAKGAEARTPPAPAHPARRRKFGLEAPSHPCLATVRPQPLLRTPAKAEDLSLISGPASASRGTDRTHLEITGRTEPQSRPPNPRQLNACPAQTCPVLPASSLQLSSVPLARSSLPPPRCLGNSPRPQAAGDWSGWDREGTDWLVRRRALAAGSAYTLKPGGS